MPKKPSANTRVATVRPRVRVAAAGAGGGGLTPANGSVASRVRRIAGHSTSTPNRTTNGTAGARFS
jgi:hypothetical protein